MLFVFAYKSSHCLTACPTVFLVHLHDRLTSHNLHNTAFRVHTKSFLVLSTRNVLLIAEINQRRGEDRCYLQIYVTTTCEQIQYKIGNIYTFCVFKQKLH